MFEKSAHNIACPEPTKRVCANPLSRTLCAPVGRFSGRPPVFGCRAQHTIQCHGPRHALWRMEALQRVLEAGSLVLLLCNAARVLQVRNHAGLPSNNHAALVYGVFARGGLSSFGCAVLGLRYSCACAVLLSCVAVMQKLSCACLAKPGTAYGVSKVPAVSSIPQHNTRQCTTA
jgi:hypothetical protein